MDTALTPEEYLELAELAKANVSGHFRQQMIRKAQRNLLKQMTAKGLITDQDETELSM